MSQRPYFVIKTKLHNLLHLQTVVQQSNSLRFADDLNDINAICLFRNDDVDDDICRF